MKLAEFLENKHHEHCAHCPHTVLIAPTAPVLDSILPGANNRVEHFNAMNTILHMMTCHPDIYAADTEMAAEVFNCYGLEL